MLMRDPMDSLTLLDRLPVGVLELSPQGEAMHVNARALALLGLDRATLREGFRHLPDMVTRQLLVPLLAARRSFTLALRLPRDEGVQWLNCEAAWDEEQGSFLCVLHDVTHGKRSEALVHEQAEQLRVMANHMPALIAYYDSDTFTCRFANQQYAATFGFTEESIVGRTFAEVIGAEAAAMIQPLVDRMLRDRAAAFYERLLKSPDGATRWIEVHLVPHQVDDDRLVGCFVLINDITKHRQAERAVRESEERLAKFMQASVEGIVFHREGVIVDVNPALLELTGYALEDMLGRDTREFVAPDQIAKVSSVLATLPETTYESAVLRKDGSTVPVELIVRTILRNGERMRMVIVRDIRDRIAAQARIKHLAHHDTLTGLPNRASFMERLEMLMSGAAGDRGRLALLFIDLDHFKRVNDSLGHLVGDALLQTVAERITSRLRTSDLVARFGGDEFMVLLSDFDSLADVEEVALKLLGAIESPVQVEGRPISVTPSIGVALFPDDGDTPGQLIKHADAAMYLAKSRGRANVQFFDPAIADSAYAELVIESELADAIERGEFVLHFQPQVRARDGVMVGSEALIRWNHPQRGLLAPDEFIPVAEQRRLMVRIGHWVLREAARCARRLHENGLTGMPVAVNLSTMQFQASGFIETLEQVLAEEQVPGSWIELELTERMLMDDLPQVYRLLGRLKAMGIRIAVDDFGTGYSSLGHLKDLPIDKMKIDRSFVMDLPDERDSAAIARAIIQMARSLEITVIAEGVENDAQRNFLALNGCDELQGDAISPPLTVVALENWAARHRG
jgi:diguanylate cyclase (GGDEF)-like protein/PAS domain S-box-containing protein